MADFADKPEHFTQQPLNPAQGFLGVLKDLSELWFQEAEAVQVPAGTQWSFSSSEARCEPEIQATKG